MKTKLYSVKAPAPIGPYSQAIAFENLIFTSGQIPIDKDGNVVKGGIKEQTKKVIDNIEAILRDNNSSLENVIKTVVYLDNILEFKEMNDVYEDYFKTSLPARSTVEVSNLPKNVKIMIEVIAFR